MKSKRAEEFINNRSELIDGQEWMVDASTARRAVELAEQDAEEEIEDKCKGFVEILETLQEEHEQQIEALKKRAVRAHIESCYSVVPSDCDVKLCTECKRTNYFIQKLNER